MIVDFHCHSSCSDGALSPAALLARAKDKGVEMLAITDHDSLAAYEDAALADYPGQMITGTELSCLWRKMSIHVVGLGMDRHNAALQAFIDGQSEAREARAIAIGERLAKRGIAGAYEEVKALAGERPIGRPDFANFLLAEGHVNNFAQAFDKYLGAGKPGDVKQWWPDIADAVAVIRQAGGVAVMAHPFEYKMTATKLRSLLQDFADAGGEAMEVYSGKRDPQRQQYALRLCQQFGLQASVGSDFHAPDRWRELGCDSELAGNISPVWERWL